MRPTALSISVISKRSTDLSPPFLVLPPLSIRFARCRVSRAFAALCSASITLGNEGYLAPYTVIFRFTMIPSTNVFGSLGWLPRICVTRNFQRCILLIELVSFLVQIHFSIPLHLYLACFQHFSRMR